MSGKVPEEFWREINRERKRQADYIRRKVAVEKGTETLHSLQLEFGFFIMPLESKLIPEMGQEAIQSYITDAKAIVMPSGAPADVLQFYIKPDGALNFTAVSMDKSPKEGYQLVNCWPKYKH